MIIKKIVGIALLLIVLSCSNDDNCDSNDQGIVFDVFLNLSTKDGTPFLDVLDFDISQIKISDQDTDFDIQDFEVVERDSQKLLKISPLNQRNINITFKNELINNFQIEVVSTNVDENCRVQIERYNVFSNQSLICTCVKNQIISLEIDI